MKLLYYADFDHFEAYDVSITGARYRKLDQGPVPDDAFAAIDRLAAEGRIRCHDVPVAGYIQRHCDPIDDVNLSVFEAREVDTLNQVVERWARHSTPRIVAATHGEAPWLAVRQNEVIPYYLAYYRNNHGEMEIDDDAGDDAGLPSEDEVFAR